jgi:hypothetical protein
MRVVEGSAFVAAPLGGMTLAQLGADVIRFDPPPRSSPRPSGCHPLALCWSASTPTRCSPTCCGWAKPRSAGSTTPGRVALPEEVAQAMLYLASPQAEFATGAVLDFDGASHVRI